MTDASLTVRIVDTSTSRYELRRNGVIVQRIGASKAQTLEAARENTATFRKLTAGVPHSLIVDLRSNPTLERGVREYYTSPEAFVDCRAIAMLINSTTGRMLGNLVLAVQNPAVPTRMFAEEADALAWLLRVAPPREA